MLGGAPAQVLEQAALYDAEQKLFSVVRVGLPAPARPIARCGSTAVSISPRSASAGAHTSRGIIMVRPQLLLAEDRGLGREMVDGAVYVGAEDYSVVGDRAQVA